MPRLPESKAKKRLPPPQAASSKSLICTGEIPAPCSGQCYQSLKASVEQSRSISVGVSSLKRGEECARAPPIPQGSLRAQRPLSHQRD